MAVVLPNRTLTLLRTGAHPWERDAYGHPVPPDPATVLAEAGPSSPGAVLQEDAKTWKLRLDPSWWPVWVGDRVTDGVQTWVIATVHLNKHPIDPTVNFVRATAVLDPPLAV
jgi:hypothetical protein